MDEEEPYKPKLTTCPYCKDKIAYMFKGGKKIAVEGNFNKELRWEEHTCYIELPNKEM